MSRHPTHPRACTACGARYTGPHYEYGCFICLGRALRLGLSDQITIRHGATPWLANFSWQDHGNYGAEALNALSS